MRRLISAVLVLAVLVLPAGCAVKPGQRSVSFGFESVVADGATLQSYAQHLQDVRATGVAISTGRPEWTAAPWPAHREAQSEQVTAAGTDYVRQAIDALARGRRLTLVVDLLAPRAIERRASNGARDADGQPSKELPSVAALDGEYGDLAVAWISEIASRYHPDAVELTELMVEDPSVPEGERVASVNRLVTRAAAAAHAHGTKLLVDVRANADAPAAGSRASGQDYPGLLRCCDGLVVWAYVGLASRDGAHVDAQRLARQLHASYGGKLQLSVGLWGDASPISASELAGAVESIAQAGVDDINVTPASLFTGEHWKALGVAWG